MLFFFEVFFIPVLGCQSGLFLLSVSPNRYKKTSPNICPGWNGKNGKKEAM
jgi:hypothetical protein